MHLSKVQSHLNMLSIFMIKILKNNMTLNISTLCILSLFNTAQSFLVTLSKVSKIAIRVKSIKLTNFILFNGINTILIDLTASNHPQRTLCNTIYYFYLGSTFSIYLSYLTKKNGNIESATKSNFSALVTERECAEMFGVIFEHHPDLRKLLLDYNFAGFPLSKEFPLSGYNQLGYTSKKRLLFSKVSLMQVLRVFSYTLPWIKRDTTIEL